MLNKTLVRVEVAVELDVGVGEEVSVLVIEGVLVIDEVLVGIVPVGVNVLVLDEVRVFDGVLEDVTCKDGVSVLSGTIVLVTVGSIVFEGVTV